MNKFGEFICKHKNLVIIISVILLLVSFIGMKLTKVNYDILVYLPDEIETIKGQNALTNDFNMGSYSIAVVDGMKSKDIVKLENKIRDIDGVAKVASAYDIVGTNIPIDFFPSEIVNHVRNNNSDLLIITFEESTSSEKTIDAVREIRNLTKDKALLGGMSSMVLDTMNLSEKEIAIYIVIAVILCILVLSISLDSYVVPFILLLNIGFAIVYNLGTNIFLGQISYITKALVAVLQLGVTTDFSIFLYHSYEDKKKQYKNNEKAMINAIRETFISVMGSSFTTILGFLALCAMQLTLGRDLGIVMAKGVLLGVVTVLTVFPSLILALDKLIEKTKHKVIVPNFTSLNKFIIKHHVAIFVVFLILLFPIYKANKSVEVYYKLDSSLPDTLESVKANTLLKEEFNIVSPEIILLDANLKNDKVVSLLDEIKKVDGIDFALSFADLKKYGITEDALNSDMVSIFKNDKYQMALINSTYDIATDDLNDQIKVINNIVKKYDKNAIVAGEGPLMKDLVEISDTDFNNVNTYSIVCIFFVLLIVLKSISLPALLILVIEFAIFTNMGISYFSGDVLPFIAPIVLGTIQLGATIDYAILLTTNYLEKRRNNVPKEEAMLSVMNYCGVSVLISGMCFFSSTFGVGIYSKIEMIGALCTLISRGALISMVVVIALLPATLLIFDKLIIKTTLNKKKGLNMKNEKKKINKVITATLIIGALTTSMPLNAFALTKSETVYSKINSDGTTKSILVNEHLINDQDKKELADYSTLENILNINSDNTYKKDGEKLTWDASGKDIFYEGTTKKSLPISLDVTYKLNGKEMNIEDMLGKSGKVTISLKYINKDKHGSLYTPFVVTMSTLIDGENNSDVTVTNGKVLSNGTKNAVVAIATPGLYESLKVKELKNSDTITISYKTTSFSLASIYQVITPKLIEASDLDIFNKLDTLYSSVDTLQNSMDLINEGANTLKEGSNELKTKLSQSIDSLASDSSDALTSADLKNIDEKTKLTIAKMFDETRKNDISKNAWESTREELENSNDKTVESYVRTSVEEAVKSSVEKAITSYLQKHPEKIQDYQICKASELNETKTEEELKSCNNVSDIDLIINTATESATLSAMKTAKLTSNYIAELVSKKVAAEVAEKTAYEVASAVANKTSKDVANEIKKASTEKVKSSLTTLYNGIDSLDNGISLLSTNLDKFNKEGINKISSLTKEEAKPLTNRIKELVKLSNKYSSFAGKNKNTKGNTKFILVIDSVEAKKEDKKAENTVKKTTFVDRVKNLFK